MKSIQMAKNRILRVIGISLVLGVFVSSALTAFSLSSWNHSTNPALLSSGNRPYFELGISSSQGFQNSYFTMDKVLAPTIVIDFDDIYDTIEDNGLEVGGNWQSEAHMTAHINRIGGGLYSNTEMLFTTTIPSELFEMLSEGNTKDTTVSETGEASLSSYTEYGGYGSYRWKDFTFAVKLGKYIPLAYSSGGKAIYSFITDSSGTIQASASIETNLYSAIDLKSIFEGRESFDPAGVMNSTGGIKIDLGGVYNPDTSRPLWGAAITNIPLYAPTAAYGWEFTAVGEFSTDGLIISLNDENEGDSYEVSSSTDFAAMDNISKRLYLPLGLGGFYRLTGVPLIDIIGHGEVVFSDPFRYNFGAVVSGSVYPLSWLSVGLAHEDMAWRSFAGLRINFRVIEFGFDIGFSSPEIKRMFSMNGITSDVYVAIGY